MDSEIMTLQGGGTVAVRRWPSPVPRRVLLALHGLESHSGWFEALARELRPKGISLIAYDRHGWGLSPGSRGRLSRPGAALNELIRVTSVLEREGLEIDLLGLSFGGLLGLYAAYRMPRRFRSLSLISPGLVSLQEPSLCERWRLGLAFLLGVPATYRLPFRPEEFVNPPELRRWVGEDPLRITEIGADTAATVQLMRGKVEKAIPHGAPVPTAAWMVRGDRIIDCAATASHLDRMGAKLSYYDDAAHSLVLEQPGRLAADLDEWLS